MANFWRTELERFKTHVASRQIESFFIMSTQNHREMKTVYTRMENISQFIEWLEYQADAEDNGYSSGLVISGGCSS